jgi:hypothetical protein
MWSHLKTAVVAAVVATLATTATVAVAGSGVGGVFNLGQSNTVNHASLLAGSTAGDQLDVANVNTGSTAKAVGLLGKSPTAPAAAVANNGGGPALGLTVNSGKSPFTVNSQAKVANLNADQLDGLDQSAFLRTTGKAADSNLFNGRNLNDFTQAGFGKTRILTNRIVIPASNPAYVLEVLTMPGVGVIGASCSSGTTRNARLWFGNFSGSVLDYWQNMTGAPVGNFLDDSGYALVGQYTDKQAGESFGLGSGDQQGPRRTAVFVQFYLFQSAPGAPCGVQVSATVWSTS